jgi:hypothetical protein
LSKTHSSFVANCELAVKLAKENGTAFYVRETTQLYFISSYQDPGWLFAAYPDGRKVSKFNTSEGVEKDER